MCKKISGIAYQKSTVETLDENTLDMQPISFHQSASVGFHTYHVGECLKIDYDAIVHIRAFWG